MAAAAALVILIAAVAVGIGFSLPPARIVLSGERHDGTVRGVLHVHTNRSDGRSSPDDIAAVARRAGVGFLVFTDHGDATRRPEPPTYRHGVLCLDAVEVSTNGGHYLAFGLPPSPYPLGGEARDVVEDVRRLGGFGVAAHPDSPKDELRWREWTAPFDALELVNPDTSWRVHLQQPGWRPRVRLLEALASYPFRPAETIASLLSDSPTTLARWEALTRRRRIVALAGVDAHAKLALGDTEPGDNRYSLAFPSYHASFSTLSVHVRPDQPLSGDAPADGAAILQAIRSGHVYTAIDGLASPPYFEFTASNRDAPDRIARAGDELPAAGPVILQVQSNAPPGFTTTIWQGNRPLDVGRQDQKLAVTVPGEPAVYRVEIRATDRAAAPAWIISNPIYVRSTEPPGRLPVRPAARESRSLLDGRDMSAWKTEADPSSVAAFDLLSAVTPAELRLRYGLSGGAAVGQFAALAVFTPGGLAPHDRLTFTARAEHPMRISVQLRAAVTPDRGERWQRSVYVDVEEGERTVWFNDLTPVGATRTWGPPLADVHSITFVIDTTNTKPGTSGRLWIKNVALQH